MGDLLADASYYLTEDQLINLSTLSTDSLFYGLNNIKHKRYIPSELEVRNLDLFDIVRIESDTTEYELIDDASEKELIEIIKRTKDINALNKYGDAPLHLANAYLSELILNRGPRFNEKYDKEVYNKMVADINVKTASDGSLKSGYTPLHYAISENNIEKVRLLIENDADTNILNDRGDPPLHTLFQGSNIHDTYYNYNIPEDDPDGVIPSARYITKEGAQGNYLFKQILDRSEILELLLESGIDVNFQNEAGETALKLASRQEDMRLHDILINDDFFGH